MDLFQTFIFSASPDHFDPYDQAKKPLAIKINLSTVVRWWRRRKQNKKGGSDEKSK
jgi:hypothetical protein